MTNSVEQLTTPYPVDSEQGGTSKIATIELLLVKTVCPDFSTIIESSSTLGNASLGSPEIHQLI